MIFGSRAEFMLNAVTNENDLLEIAHTMTHTTIFQQTYFIRIFMNFNDDAFLRTNTHSYIVCMEVQCRLWKRMSKIIL